MKLSLPIAYSCLLVACSATPQTWNDPGTTPDNAERSVERERSVLENAVIRGQWKLAEKQIASLTIENKHTGQKIAITTGPLPRIVLGDGRAIDLASIQPAKPMHLEKQALVAVFGNEASGLELTRAE